MQNEYAGWTIGDRSRKTLEKFAIDWALAEAPP
jgi:hypothetical protein